ncbi:MAG: sulfite exporter TauE/SafE family protein [Nanoarchaeota archaeon]
MDKEKSVIKELTYFVKGMHCPSCEILIEKKLLEEDGVEGVEASAQKGEVTVEYEGTRPSVEKLNQIFKKDNYTFSEKIQSVPVQSKSNLSVVLISLAVILMFIIFNESGLSSLVRVNGQSSLIAFFFFGLLAGVSSCAALVGGIILSMSKQWSDLYSDKGSFYERFKPHLLFNSGRIVSYVFFGGLLGALGSLFQFSIIFSSVLVFAVSVIMIVLALQMLGIEQSQRFQFTIPKVITRYVSDESNFKARYMPFLMGAATFLLPCGFTLSVQALAITSGSFIRGALVMLSFVLGTVPGLALIGLSSTKFLKKPHLADKFLKVAGILVLFFALYNMNAQLNVLGLFSLSDININQSTEDSLNGFVPIVSGKQLIKMDALSYAYEPNYFKIKINQPVRLEVTDKGTSGCTNAIISRDLFDGEIKLIRGETSVKEFTVEKAGKYKFSCWMGMVSGIIEVVDVGGAENNSKVISSGATDSCGSSCTGSCGGGCGNPGCSAR